MGYAFGFGGLGLLFFSSKFELLTLPSKTASGPVKMSEPRTVPVVIKGVEQSFGGGTTYTNDTRTKTEQGLTKRMSTVDGCARAMVRLLACGRLYQQCYRGHPPVELAIFW